MNGAGSTSLPRRIVSVLALPVTLVAAWWITSADSQNFYFPPLQTILHTFVKLWFSPQAVPNVLPSLLRFAVGYLAAALLGIAIGVPVGAWRTLRSLLEPMLEFLRAIPPPVLVPVLMLFAGIGDTMKTLVIVFGCIWPVLLNTVAGVRALDDVLAEVVRSYRIGAFARLWHFVLPGASPQIFTGLRQSLSIGIILMVVSEMFAASNGIGFALVQYQRTFAIPEMWGGIILLGLIGIALSLVFRAIEAWFLGWYHGLRRLQRAA
ncbi:MAG TPA: ABC transporter permease [Xanthobacteraceae bacterium]|jgi:ABC-type nitrate/sulfonate/bicarbonate transport system permease component